MWGADRGRWGDAGREAQEGAHTRDFTALFLFLRATRCPVGSVENPLPCLFWSLRAARLTLGSGPASPTTFSSPSVLCLQRSSSSSPRFRRSHRQTRVISLFKRQGVGNLHFTHSCVFYHLRFHGFPGRECEHLVSRHESATASPLHHRGTRGVKSKVLIAHAWVWLCDPVG